MSLNNNATTDSLDQLGELKPAKEKNTEEEGAASGKGASSVCTLAVEQGADDERIGDDDEDLGV